jgi:hypothetical protein
MTQWRTYADLEIRILDLRDEGYPVEITVNSEQEFPRGYLRPDFLPWVSSASPAEDGERLFGWLFTDDRLKTAWAEVRGGQPQRRVRLRMDANAPELHAIPWELLRDPGDGTAPQDLAAATATPFSRYLAGKWQPGSPILKRPIKMLVAIANPQNLADYELDPVDVAAEWASLQEVTAGLGVELAQLPEPCTLSALEAELKKGYHILHFVGHGAYREKHGKAVLYMADPENQTVLVDDADLVAMLARQLADTEVGRQDKLRLVFLSSCQTATRSPADAFRGLAPQLVAAGVPAVLAMQDLVPVSTAREFSRAFYQGLLQHGLIDLASNEARSALLTGELSGAAIPALFMRLRNGQLLGQRGVIAGDKSETFWPFLLENIERGSCIPFLGPRVNEGLLPGADSVAEQLADKYGYPLPDRQDLAKVAQFIAINDPGLLCDEYVRLMRRSLFGYLGLKPTREDKKRYKDADFTDTAAGLEWAEQVLAVQENEIHHMLADLRLPLYITTNFDSFMFEALKHKGFDPRRIGLRWEQAQAGTPQYVLKEELRRENPVVLHLNGYDADPEQRRHLVLSEDDYLAHFVRMARDHDHVLPSEIITALTESSFLFLGYGLYDWEFRVILQGLVQAIKRPTKLNVGVQLEADPDLDTDKVIDYFRRYLGRFDIEIYWGTPQQFVTELHSEWQQHVSSAVDEDEGYWEDENW